MKKKKLVALSRNRRTYCRGKRLRSAKNTYVPLIFSRFVLLQNARSVPLIEKMPTPKRECSFLGCLLSPRLYGVIVGVVSLWAMMASLSASIYLMVKFNDIKDVPDSCEYDRDFGGGVSSGSGATFRPDLFQKVPNR